MLFTPNFRFGGNCEEAINLYQKAFHGKITCMLRYSERNKNDWDGLLSPEQENCIYHAELLIGDYRMMMCDDFDVAVGKSTSLALTVTFDTKEEVKAVYDVLKEDSETIYPMHSTTYSSCMVTLIDKFGFRWGLMTEQTDR